MKTKEFISKMDDMAGVRTCAASFGAIHIYNFDGKELGAVSIDNFGEVYTNGEAIDNMKDKEEVVKLLFEYALTPLSEREDEPKFRVKILPDIYLNQDKDNKNIFLNDPHETYSFQTVFTKSEYNKLQQKYSEWLPKFDEKDPHFEFLEEDK